MPDLSNQWPEATGILATLINADGAYIPNKKQMSISFHDAKLIGLANIWKTKNN